MVFMALAKGYVMVWRKFYCLFVIPKAGNVPRLLDGTPIGCNTYIVANDMIRYVQECHTVVLSMFQILYTVVFVLL